MMRRWGTLAVIAWLAAGCTTPTQLVVVVDSDYAVGTEIDTVDVVISSAMGRDEHRFALAETGLPFSFGVLPVVGDSEPVVITVSGMLSGESVTRHEVHTRFLPGRRLQLDVPLARACHDDLEQESTCSDSGQRCLYGACVPAEVDPETLADATGELPDLFDGTTPSDAGGPADAGPPPPADSGPPCVAGEQCYPGVPCAVGRWTCVEGERRCEMVMTCEELGATCGEGGRCQR